jgi:hypothetical protein
MNERPILFSAPMVRAILAGTKTQTRRVVNPQPCGGFAVIELGILSAAAVTDSRGALIRCPYGKSGDRLWVRETWRPTGVCAGQWTSVYYRADKAQIDRPYFYPNLVKGGWRPAIHMPRAACRLMLEVTAVRVERLQEITEDDARAEGISAPTSGSFRGGYAILWDSLNAKRGFGWATNPWVWVVTFDRAAVDLKAAA